MRKINFKCLYYSIEFLWNLRDLFSPRGSFPFFAVGSFILAIRLRAVFPAMAELVQALLISLRKSPFWGLTTKSKIYTTVWYPFLCLIHSLITPLKHRHMIRLLKNGLISALTLYIWLKYSSTNSRTTPAQ